MATFTVGDVVVNFSNVARVLAVDPLRGLLLQALPGQAFGARDRWFADPAKCRPVVEVVRALALCQCRSEARSAAVAR